MNSSIAKIFTGDNAGSTAADQEVAALTALGFTSQKKLLTTTDNKLTLSPPAPPAGATDFGEVYNETPNSLWVVLAVN